MVRTCAQQIWKLREEDQPSGRPSQGLDARSLSKEITCSGRTTVRMTVPHRPDAALKQERFSAKIQEFWAPSFIKAVAHLNPQPINRVPWALRTARIRY